MPLYFVTFVLAAYLAVANVLRGAKWPDEPTWAPWTVWFVLILVAAVWVPVYALYKALDAHFEASDRRQAQLLRDLEIACQQVVAVIGETCDQVDVNDLAAQVWLSRSDGTFKRLVRFHLPHERTDLRADLRPMYAKLEELGPAAFDRLDGQERYGMTAQDFQNAGQCGGICAIRLPARDDSPRLLGFFVVDYMGTDHFDCVSDVTETRRVGALIGGCETVLTEASGSL